MVLLLSYLLYQLLQIVPDSDPGLRKSAQVFLKDSRLFYYNKIDVISVCIRYKQPGTRGQHVVRWASQADQGN
jgi:hypothetical protein